MKKNNTGIIVAVIVILLLLGGAYYFMHHGNSMMHPMQAGEGANPQSQASTQKKSLFDFFSMAGSQKCTFSDDTNKSAGTVYVSSGKMRGDFQESNNSTGKTEQTHMINDGTYVYMWTDGQNNGYKMSDQFVKQEEAQSSEAKTPSNAGGNPQPSQGVDMHQKANYSCGGWSADNSLFTPPSDVSFTDYSSMMQGQGTMMHGGSTGTTTQQGSQGSAPAGGNAAACSECNQAPAGSARNQCLAALHCQ